jgi:hypothetical protein
MNLSGSPSKPTKVKCAQSVKVNGSTKTDGQDVLDALEHTASKIKANEGASGAQYAQLVRYVKNSSGEISAITTIAMQNNSIKVGSNTNMDLLMTGAEKTEYTYTLANGFGGKVFVSTSTLVLEIPDNRQDETSYKRSTATSYFKGNSSYKVAAYDINESNVAKVVLVYNVDANDTATAIDAASPLYVIKQVDGPRISQIAEEEQTVYVVTAYKNGKTETFETVSTQAPYDTIKPGDVLRLGFNGEGQIYTLGRKDNGSHELDVDALAAMVKVDKYANGTEIKTEGGVHYFKAVYGTVSKLTSDYIFIAPAMVDTTGEEATLDVSEEFGLKLSSSAYKYRVHLKANGETEVSVLSDLNTIVEFGELKNANATRVFVHAYTGTLKNLIVVIDERPQP